MSSAGAATAVPSFWQVGLALVAVLGLLLVVLKFLQRLQTGSSQETAVRLLSVRRLGPRRELQILQVGDSVHTLYRHDGAMVVLDTQPLSATGDAGKPATGATPPSGSLPRLRALIAVAGGRVRTGRDS